MEELGATLLAVAGLLHLPPVAGVLGSRTIERLYGVTVDQPSIAILLRHRSVLFGLIGALLIAAVWSDSLRPAAIAGAFISDVTFLAVTGDPRRLDHMMRRVAIVDIASIVLLVTATALLLAA